jgi:hypothetical protein
MEFYAVLDNERAVSYWQHADEHAIQRSAYVVRAGEL